KDLAVADFGGTAGPGSVTTMVGDGSGGFAPVNWYDVGASLSAIWAGDLNGDGKADVAVTNSGSAANTVSVLLGNVDGTLPTTTDSTAGTNPSSIAAADLNGDSHTDLAVTNQGSNSVSILLGIGNGTFQPRTDFATGSSPASVALGDLNGDHKL